MKYSVVIPCYRSEKTIGQVVACLEDEFRNEEYEIVLVNDGSPDKGATMREIFSLADNDSRISAIDLAKNTGQHNAILCALNYTQGDYVICMDDDMQTHPSEIKKLIAKIEEGYDVVYACYPQKKHAWYRNLGSRFSSWTVSKLIGKPKGLKTSSFWIARRFVVQNIIQYKNANAFIPGLMIRTTDSIANVEVSHFEREEGQSGYTMRKLFMLWSNVIGFSVKPLRMASAGGAVLAFGGLIGAVVAIIRKLVYGVSSEGWTSLIAVICFFAGIILLFMGLIGEYIGRMFLASGNQPQYVIREIKKGVNDEKSYDFGRGDLPSAADTES